MYELGKTFQDWFSASKHPIIAAAALAALTYVFRTWIEKLVKQLLRPFQWLGNQFYLWIAPRNPFSISLRKYKRHVGRSNLAFLENPVGPPLRVSLERSFAPLKLISNDEKQEIDFFSYVTNSDRFIVLGGPGTGKTTLMKNLVQSVINNQCIEPQLNKLIPVFVVLRNLASKSHTVQQAIVAALADHYFPGADKFIASALEEGKLIIILDGLDEVGTSREFVVNQIQTFCLHDEQRNKKNKVIVTCREASYRTRDLRDVISAVVRVEPFGNDHMRIFLRGWPPHGGKYALSLYSQIQNDSQIKDVCRNPLLLTILTGLFLDADRFELPTSRDSFYVAAIDELMLQRPARRRIQQKYAPDKKQRLLEMLALRRLESVLENEDPEELSRSLLQSSAKEFFTDEHVDPDELLQELTDMNGILKPTAEEIFTFPHRTVQEYLAAKECHRSRETTQVVAEANHRIEMLEVLYFYCGIVKNIPQLNSILEELLSNTLTLEAAKCLNSMTETPSTVLINRATEAILANIQNEVDPESALIILSSLSGRKAAGFKSARSALTTAIDMLMAPGHRSGAWALESALATSPELAMKVVPALLASSSIARQRSALNLLRDIGTEQALYQLVELLKSRRYTAPCSCRNGDREYHPDTISETYRLRGVAPRMYTKPDYMAIG
jgi:hypothetical protein